MTAINPDRNEVDFRLVSGVYRLHWRDGEEFNEFEDSVIVDRLAPFPTDAEAGLFSFLQQI